MRKYSFSQRVINEWNKLPTDCVNASSVNMFKNRIENYHCIVGNGTPNRIDPIDTVACHAVATSCE